MAEHAALTRAVRELILAGDRFRNAAGRPRGIPSRGMTALVHIYLDGALTASELARRLDVSTPSTAELVEKLRSGGLVRRHPHPDDRRKLLVELTDRGYTEVAETYDDFAARLGPLTVELSPTQRRDVLVFLRAAREVLSSP